ncbi:hypothetical protein HDG33_003873 [Paraburkholderia sp. Cpub6]|nr:hypothetical protein [Paraburkholderia sp. Cpub6]
MKDRTDLSYAMHQFNASYRNGRIPEAFEAEHCIVAMILLNQVVQILRWSHFRARWRKPVRLHFTHRAVTRNVTYPNVSREQGPSVLVLHRSKVDVSSWYGLVLAICFAPVTIWLRMNRPGFRGHLLHRTAAQAGCLHKLTDAAGFQLKIARETLPNIASVFMTRRFSTTC